MISKLTCLFICIMTCVWSTRSAAAEAAKPTRADCIIGYHLDWSAVKNANDVHNSMGEFSFSFEKQYLPDRQYLAADAFSADGSAFYLAYKDHCDQKEKFAERLIRLWQSHGLDLPKLDRIPDPVKISLSTIDVYGPWWSDGQSPDSFVGKGKFRPFWLATDLQRTCAHTEPSCSSFITGVLEVAVNNPVDGIKLCSPEPGRVIVGPEINSIVLQWINAHPEKGAEPASRAIVEALYDAYHCQKAH
jgi:hypothetical protein